MTTFFIHCETRPVSLRPTIEKTWPTLRIRQLAIVTSSQVAQVSMFSPLQDFSVIATPEGQSRAQFCSNRQESTVRRLTFLISKSALIDGCVANCIQA